MPNPDVETLLEDAISYRLTKVLVVGKNALNDLVVLTTVGDKEAGWLLEDAQQHYIDKCEE